MSTRRSSTASIDDLLGYEEEPAAAEEVRRRRFSWKWLIGSLLLAAGLAWSAVLVARMFGVGLPQLVTFASIFALLTLLRVLRGVAPQRLRPGRERPDADGRAESRRSALSMPERLDRRSAQDGAVTAASRWETRLSWTQSDPERFAKVVLPALTELVDERLRQRHGFTRATDPGRARELLGDPLWTFLADVPKKSPTPREFAALLAQLEAL